LINMTITENTPISLHCNECNGFLIFDSERGDTICSNCGLVVSERAIDFKNEGKRAYSIEEASKKLRMGEPINPLTINISQYTIIRPYEIEDPDFKRAVRRDRKYKRSDFRNLLEAKHELKRIISNLNLPKDIREKAFILYKKAFEEKLTRGRTIVGMISSCIVYFCKKASLPIGISEISKEIYISKKELSHCYRVFLNELELSNPIINGLSNYISKYRTELGLSFEIEKLLRESLGKIPRFEIIGKNPKTVLAGLFYLVSKNEGLGLKQKDIAKVMGITEVSLRMRSKQFKRVLS
jgi:transcription initiation factor TFIIB